jgi:transcriptional regulator with XRE-family HTH domain
MMSDPLKLHVSEIIHSRRVAAGLSLEDISKQTGIEIRRLSKYEADSTGMSTEELQKITAAIGVEFSEVFEAYKLPGATKAAGGS